MEPAILETINQNNAQVLKLNKMTIYMWIQIQKKEKKRNKVEF